MRAARTDLPWCPAGLVWPTPKGVGQRRGRGSSEHPALGPVCRKAKRAGLRRSSTWCDAMKYPQKYPQPRSRSSRMNLWELNPSCSPTDPSRAGGNPLALLQGRATVPLSHKGVPADFAGIPWGTIIRLKFGREELLLPVGPAYRSGGSLLPVFFSEDAAMDCSGPAAPDCEAPPIVWPCLKMSSADRRGTLDVRQTRHRTRS